MSPNSSYQIGISKITDHRLPEPYNSCQDLPDPVKYHQHNCITKCLHNMTLDQFNCSLPSYYHDQASSEFCLSNVNTEVIGNLTEVCTKQCPEECNSVKFNTHVLNSQSYNNRLELVVYFSALSNLKLNQVPKMSLFVLVSTIGGSLSLFIGLEFLSIIEISQILIEVVFINLRGRKTL